MKKLGFERKRTKERRGYVVYKFTDLEKKEMTRRDAALAIDEGDSDDTGDTIF
jgi:hypothetical protein